MPWTVIDHNANNPKSSYSFILYHMLKLTRSEKAWGCDSLYGTIGSSSSYWQLSIAKFSGDRRNSVQPPRNRLFIINRGERRTAPEGCPINRNANILPLIIVNRITLHSHGCHVPKTSVDRKREKHMADICSETYPGSVVDCKDVRSEY